VGFTIYVGSKQVRKVKKVEKVEKVVIHERNIFNFVLCP